MAKKYDVIVIGGGHNGLVNAAYLAKAGKKVLVLESVTFSAAPPSPKKSFPASNFLSIPTSSRLLRPEIIRDLDLPRHGLGILPLDGTITPMSNGDYLWRQNDHGKTAANSNATRNSTPKPTKNLASPWSPCAASSNPSWP